MPDTVQVCNRCGSSTCWATGRAVCAYDGVSREVAAIPYAKWVKNDEARPKAAPGRIRSR